MSVKMIVAFHKPYRVPEKSCYLPMHVGASGKQSLGPAWTRDDTGDNISDKNASFCELTGIYWAWKHISADIIGTAHYRRYFVNQKWWNKPFNRILDEQQIEAMLQGHDAILPKKRHYYIETRESQYCHAHHPEDLACVRQVLTEKYPDYLPQWDEMLKTRSGHIFNMFIMRQPLFDAYMTWLMDILFTVE
ncbi:MAG: DUF4422 domain-containing protein, partial [Clostridia bacterium]|nr:DUF4422 domain-containing protein [Clostridia bacterium]